MGTCCCSQTSDDRKPVLPESERHGRSSAASNYKKKTVYHGTTSARADRIQREGIRPSADGMLGPGVYVSADYNKALREAKRRGYRDGGGQPTVLEFDVNVGSVMVIDRKDHPRRLNWQSTHDSAWVPPNTRDLCPIGGSEESCIKDPRRLHFVKRYDHH